MIERPDKFPSFLIPKSHAELGNQEAPNIQCEETMKRALTGLIITFFIFISEISLYASSIVIDGTLINDGTLIYDILPISPYVIVHAPTNRELKSIEIPAEIVINNTKYSVSSIQSCAFEGCTNLTSVTLPNSMYTIWSNAFKDCTALTSIKIPESVTTIDSRAFQGCTSLTSVTLTNSETRISDNVFRGCSSLTSITLPDSLRSIGDYAFFACSSLTTIAIPDHTTSIGNNAFSKCSSLTTVTIPGSIQSFGSNIFLNCDNLKTINYKTTKPVAIDKSAFDNAVYDTAILNVAIGGLDLARSTSAWMFFKNIQEWEFNNTNDGTEWLHDGIVYTLFPTLYDTPFAFITGNNLTEITQLTIPESIICNGIKYEVGIIDKYAFSGCRNLSSVIIPNSVWSVRKYAFSECSNLTSVKNFRRGPFIHEGTFFGCSSLTDISISDNIEHIYSYAFEGCHSLTSVTIPSSVGTIDAAAFADCNSLKSIFVEKNNPKYADVDGVLYSKSLTTLQQYPAGLTEVHIPNTVKSIGNSAFKGCRRITSVTIPNTVTEIEDYAFYNCSSLLSVEIPTSITQIGTSAFDGNTPLSYIYSYAKVPPSCGVNVFNKNILDRCTLYVPAGTKKAYMIAQPWSEFSSIEEMAIEGTPVSEIELNKSLATLMVGETDTLEYNVKPYNASNKQVEWISLNPDVATVSSTGEITAISIGETAIIVSATDGSEVSATCSIKVTPESLTISADGTTTLKATQQVQLYAEVNSFNIKEKTVVWSSSDETVVSVNSNGLVTANGVGKAIIKASCEHIESEITITVETTLAESIVINHQDANIKVGEKLQLIATVLPNTATNPTVEWTSSNSGVVSVDANGVITAISEGDAIVTASSTDGSNLHTDCIITVEPTPVECVTIYDPDKWLKDGETVTLSYSIYPPTATDQSLTWESDNNDIATVENGIVTAHSQLGDAHITATASNGVKASVGIRVVSTPVTDVEINWPDGVTFLYPNEHAKMIATIYPTNATSKWVNWSVEDSSVIHVDSDGTVTALQPGQSYVYANSSDGACGSLLVTVKEPEIELHLHTNEKTFHQGSFSGYICVITTPSNATPYIDWSYIGDAALTINRYDGGKVISLTADRPGKATLTARYGDWSEDCEITVLQPPFEPETIDFVINGETLNYDQQIEAYVGETLYVSVYYLINITNVLYYDPYFAYENDIIEINEISQDEYEPLSSGYIIHYAITPKKTGKSQLFVICNNAEQRIWIDVNESDGINSAVMDSEQMDPIYYDLQGNVIQTDNLQPGIYIKKTGQTFEKVVINRNIPILKKL
ncbi:MAG: leucine-rich repeat protein [Bacteroides sp.]|nr:leucine-rich repeat protein [Bacteroides sp.]